ncbi:MAG: N-acetyltransferase family protein [Bacteroidota bacterium]
MVTIRSATYADTQAQLDIYAPFILHTVTSFETEVPTAEAFWQRIQKVQTEAPWLVCEIDGNIAGYAYASSHRSRQAYQWSREVSVYIHEAYRRRGIAQALYRALLDLIEWQGYRNAYAGIVLPNPASVAFHESMGFEKIGIYKAVGYKNGAWQDVSWWSLRLGDWQSAPETIIDLTTILHNQQKTAAVAGIESILRAATSLIKT